MFNVRVVLRASLRRSASTLPQPDLFSGELRPQSRFSHHDSGAHNGDTSEKQLDVRLTRSGTGSISWWEWRGTGLRSYVFFYNC